MTAIDNFIKKLSIPERGIGVKWIQFHEKLDNPIAFKRIINAREITFLVEPVR